MGNMHVKLFRIWPSGLGDDQIDSKLPESGLHAHIILKTCVSSRKTW